MSEYTDNWIETYTGKRFHFKNPSLDEIDIRDIAHALSLKCRFGGHCKELYTVGEHSIRVAELLPPHLQLSGLLHDAAEAYLPDVPRPIKYAYGLQEPEERIIEVINCKFGVSHDSKVKEADNILLATEARDLMINTFDWAKLEMPLRQQIVPSHPRWIEAQFLMRFKEYGGVES